MDARGFHCAFLLVGRPRKPSARRELEGNRGHRPIPKEPTSTLGVPTKSRGLSGPVARTPKARLAKRRRIYDEFAASLAGWNVLHVTDRVILEQAATLAEEVEYLDRLILRDGYRDSGGLVRPEVAILRNTRSELVKCLAKLGFTPVDRARIFASMEAADDKPTSRIGSLINFGNEIVQ